MPPILFSINWQIETKNYCTAIQPLLWLWADASVRKDLDVGLEIMRLKFYVQAQDMTKINITHVKQPDAISCGAMVCYYAEKIFSAIIFFGCFTLHTSEAYSEPSQTSKMKLFVNVINGFCKNFHLRCLTEFWIHLCSLWHITAFSSCIFKKSGTSQIWLLPV